MHDQTLTCRDCGQAFTFTAGEQEFFASRGFDNAPSRCPECRAARKTERNAGYGGYERREREMFAVTCSACGQEARVPFQPTGDKPVYCSSCFQQRGGGSRSGAGYGRSRS
jgi:CxxC-x17-CxxC domain-containing protein